MKKIFFVPDTRNNRRKAAQCLNTNKPQKNVFILLAMPATIHSVTAVLDMPPGNADKGARAKEVTDACEASTYVTVPPATIAAVRLKITDYNNATPATRPNLYRLMHNDLNELMDLFQQAANDDPANAVAIIESGAFKVKHMAIPQKHEFKAENNPVSGVIDLSAEGGGDYACHDWKYSADGINYTRMTPTVAAHTQKDGLIPNRFAWFTHELITKDGPQGISQPIKIEVK